MPAPWAQLPGQSHSCPLLTQAETLGVILGCPLATCLTHKEIELALSSIHPDSRLPHFAATAPTAGPRSRQPGPLPDPALPARTTSRSELCGRCWHRPQSKPLHPARARPCDRPLPRTSRLTAPSPAHQTPFPTPHKVLSSGI